MLIDEIANARQNTDWSGKY